jgi:hypothetical protein
MAESAIPKPEPEPETSRPTVEDSKIYSVFGTVSECIGLLAGSNFDAVGCGEVARASSLTIVPFLV